MESDRERRIRERAYEIWEREGKPHGREAEHWQKAVVEVTAEAGADAERALAGSRRGSEAAPPPGPSEASPEPVPLRRSRAVPRRDGGDKRR